MLWVMLKVAEENVQKQVYIKIVATNPYQISQE